MQGVDASLITSVHSAAVSLKRYDLCIGGTLPQGISALGWSQPYAIAIELQPASGLHVSVMLSIYHV